jgi:hypothetical protein
MVDDYFYFISCLILFAGLRMFSILFQYLFFGLFVAQLEIAVLCRRKTWQISLTWTSS